MDNKKHNEEIKRTRACGFGGSDAAMLVAIAERIKNGQELTTTQKHRVRVAKGLETPRPDYTNEAIENGRKFEDEIARNLYRAESPITDWDREVFLSSGECIPANFHVFAHADFCDLKTMAVKECKWSDTYTKDDLLNIYKWQLQWYYMLGAVSVSMTFRAAGGERGTVDVPRDEDAILTLTSAWRTIDERWDFLELDITEFGEEDTAPSVLAAIRTLHRLTFEKQRLDEEIAALKEEIGEAFRVNNATKFHGDYGSITMVPASETLQLDTKKMVKDHPDIVAAYRTKIVRKPEYLVCKFK